MGVIYPVHPWQPRHRCQKGPGLKGIGAGAALLPWSPGHTLELPETGRGVVQGVISSLHFVLQDRGALFEGKPQQVISDDHHRDPCRANILLGTSKNHTKLPKRKRAILNVLGHLS